MTDKEKLDATRAEIHRLVDVRGYDKEMANDLFAFMDSLPNEPVNEQNLSNVQRFGKNWKEPVSEDLGDYINELSKQFSDVSFAKLSRIAVRVAKWQKEKFMAKAVDGHVTFEFYGLDSKTYGTIAHDPICFEDFDINDSDKVKLLVLKEV